MAIQRSYDVFITSQGDDTHNGFTDILGKNLKVRGIHTFIDNQEGRSEGDEIPLALSNVIQESRIAIIVLSENYAASSVCLKKLEFILENFHQNHTGRFIYPVFYDIDRSHVKWLVGPIGKAFSEHWLKKSNEKVFKWRNVLTQVANLSSGWNFIHRDENEFEFINKIVDEVSQNIHRLPLPNVDYLVGLNSRMGEVCSLLELESNEVLVVGIYGGSGIGKTTLARAVYNMIVDQFEASCFLSDLSKHSNSHGIVQLQHMLLSKMTGLKDIQLGNSRDERVSVIKKWLHQKKVLLILDDVVTLEQLEALVGGLDWFGSGSRVIVTTQNKSLTTYHRVEVIYELGELTHKEARKFLELKLSKQLIVDPDYKVIFNVMVHNVSGIPLALELIASILLGESVDQWHQALQRFELIPHKTIQNIIRACFDLLDKEEKNIFLDITCCFKGYELTDIENILGARYDREMKDKIKALIDKTLMNISMDGKVTPHPLMESMGKEIVYQESPNDPGKRSRLWSPVDILEVLTKNTGTDKIEIIHMDFPIVQDKVIEWDIEWDGKAFKNMKNLKILINKNFHFSRAPKYLPESLKVLAWWRYPSDDLPSDFDSEQLVIRKLPKQNNQLLKILQRAEIEAEKIWRLVGVVSNIVGLLCYARSPCFDRLIGSRKPFKFVLYGILFLVIFIIISIANKSSFSTHSVQLKTYTSFAVLMIISWYSFVYDRAVNEEPDILSIVSNYAFALVTLSLHKLVNYGFEIGVFSYFLGCFTIQLLTISRWFIIVAIIVGCPPFLAHSSLFSQPKESSGGQVNHSFQNSGRAVSDGDRVNRSVPDSGRPVSDGNQHVVDIDRKQV